MTVNTMSRSVAATLLLAVAVAAGCAHDHSLQSRWADASLGVDTGESAWQNVTPVEAQGVSVAVRNNDASVLVRLSVTDRTRQWQILRGGCTVWFDPSGGQNLGFGVRYPLEREPAPDDTSAAEGRRSWRRPGGTGAGEPGRSGEQGERGETGERSEMGERGEGTQGAFGQRMRDPRRLAMLLHRLPREYEVRVPRSAIIRRYGVGSGDVSVSIRYVGNVLVYELQVPMQVGLSRGEGIGAKPGTVIGVGIETPEIERPQRGQTQTYHHGAAGGGMRGGEGGEAGETGEAGEGGWAGDESRWNQPGSGLAGMESTRPPDPIHLWIKVHLDTPGGPSQR